MATSADVLDKYFAYAAALTVENTAYGHSISFLSSTAIDGTPIAGFGSTRPVVNAEADLDTYNAQVAARNAWDISLIAAQSAYSDAVTDRRKKELDLIAIIPANQWIIVEGVGLAHPVFIGYRGPSGYPMIRSRTFPSPPPTSGNPFNDVVVADISQTYVWYHNAFQNDFNADLYLTSLGTRPGYPPSPPVSPGYIGVSPADETTFHSLVAQQTTWDSDHYNGVFDKTRTTIDLDIYTLRLIVALPPNFWVQVTLSPTLYVGYRLADTKPLLLTATGVTPPPFPLLP